jgi:peptidoglycan/LPS O-acetylase OafA/YrhL
LDNAGVTFQGKTETPAVWRSVALITLVFGAIASIGLLRHAQEHPPPIVVAGFVVWVLAPFVLLSVAHFLSGRWPRRTQITLHVVTLIITLLSLAIYLDDNIAHRTAKRAFVYVAVPPAAVLVAGIALALAVLKGRQSKAR